MFDCIKQYYRQPLKMFCCLWGWILDLTLVLKPCRFSVISLAFGFIFFGLAPQGVDILRAMSETGRGYVFNFLFFYACIWLWAISIWYWARHMLRFEHIYKHATDTPNKARATKMVEEVPRVLGGLAFWSLWVALLKSGRIYPDDVQSELAIAPGLFAYIYFFSGIVFYSFAKSRRWLLGKMLQLPETKQLHAEFIRGFMDMPKVARSFAILLIVISLVALFWTSTDPVAAASIGTSGLLLIAAANWVFIGSIIVFFSDKYRVPGFSLLLIMALVFSAWNDNHTMRTTGELVNDTRSDIKTHFNNWLTPRLQKWQQNPANQGKPYPLFLVAAEGGGIRAAYWTTNVLGALQDSNEKFSDHVYVMSGVSGGSLGIATFSSLLKARQEGATFASACNTNGQFSYQACAQAFYRNDFLAPPVGRMLYGDLIQRFLPFSVSAFDRATAIEQAWESAWHDLAATDYFSEPFLALYQQNNLPVMFLNSTWVEKGTRTVTSNVKLAGDFLATKDLHVVTGQQLRLSTAVHNSARFTYVSPAATVQRKNGQVWGHVVDGGYFENSGTVTLAESYRAMQQAAGNKWAAIRPVILMITNDPGQNDEREANPTPIANEVRSPLDAMLNTRSGRGTLARAELKQHVQAQQGIFKELGLQHVEGPVPLGWMLSRAAMKTMDDRLQCYITELSHHNALNIAAGQDCNSKP